MVVQFVAFLGAYRNPGDLDPLLGVRGELFGIQRVAIAPAAFSLEQRAVGIAQ